MRVTKKHIDNFFENGRPFQLATIGTFTSYVSENYKGGRIRVLNHSTDGDVFYLNGSTNSTDDYMTVDKKHPLHQQIIEKLIAYKLST